MIEKVRLLRHGQITIPASIRRKLKIREGSTGIVKVEGRKIVIEFIEPELPRVRIGRRIGLKDVKKLVAEGISDKLKVSS